MPRKILSKRKTKSDRSGWLARQRVQRNLPVSYPRPSNMLVKSQYCDFEMPLLVPIQAVAGIDVERSTTFSRYDFGGIIASVWGFNNSPLWRRIRTVFEEYAVKGFRLEWIPGNIDGRVDTNTTVQGSVSTAYVF